jgi:hypothetical protein
MSQYCTFCGKYNAEATSVDGESWHCEFCDHENVNPEFMEDESE